MSELPRIEYVEARRVLLDVLSALREQLDAVVLVGTQAVYLRTAGRLPTYQPFTTDADIVVDPSRLSDRPPIGAAMTTAGFVLTDERVAIDAETIDGAAEDLEPEPFIQALGFRVVREHAQVDPVDTGVLSGPGDRRLEQQGAAPSTAVRSGDTHPHADAVQF